MGSKKPEVYKLPQQQQQQQQQQFTNTFSPFSIADTPEAKDFMSTPLDFGDETNVDPGVGRRTDLGEQEVSNRYDSAFMSGVPAWIRNINRAKEVRDVQGQGAYERQQAEYLNQQGNNQRRGLVTQAELERKRLLLPQILQTSGMSSGSGSSSGFTSQLGQDQPGFWQRAALGAVQGAGSTIGAIKGF